MFVAEALDEMMAGTLFADVSEPLYVNVCAPDNDKAVAVEDGVIEPVIDIVAADVQATPTAAPPPVIFPFIFNVVPEKFTATKVLAVVPPVISPFIVKFPADWFIPALIKLPAPAVAPLTSPFITVFPFVDDIA